VNLLLHLIIGNAALELVPWEISRHPAVVRNARIREKEPASTLLDRTLHHTAMLQLKDGDRRGRPDLIHFALLEATSTPLYIQKMLKVYVHTCRDYVIHLGESVRLPKTYLRFVGLVEQLFEDGIIRTGNKTLLTLKKNRFKDLLSQIEPSKTVGFSRLGIRRPLEDIAEEHAKQSGTVLVVGGFPRGHFSEEISLNLTASYAIHTLPLEAHVIIARVLYEFEKHATI
jgi:rRNA small subunit pseudouridine methyltransferase Nep1